MFLSRGRESVSILINKRIFITTIQTSIISYYSDFNTGYLIFADILVSSVLCIWLYTKEFLKSYNENLPYYSIFLSIYTITVISPTCLRIIIRGLFFTAKVFPSSFRNEHKWTHLINLLSIESPFMFNAQLLYIRKVDN